MPHNCPLARAMLQSVGIVEQRSRSSWNRARLSSFSVMEPRAPPFQPKDLQSHGPLIGLCAPSVSLCLALSAPPAHLASRDPDRRRCGRCLLGQHAIWRQILGRHTIGGARPQQSHLAGILVADVVDCCRQFSLAHRELDGELHFCGSDWRPQARHVPPFDRSRAELFQRSHARHADKSHHGDFERRFYRRKHVRLECVAALHCHSCGDCADRNRQPADGGWVDRDRWCDGAGDVSYGCRRQAASRRFCRQGRDRRRRDGRRHQ